MGRLFPADTWGVSANTLDLPTPAEVLAGHTPMAGFAHRVAAGVLDLCLVLVPTLITTLLAAERFAFTRDQAERPVFSPTDQLRIDDISTTTSRAQELGGTLFTLSGLALWLVVGTFLGLIVLIFVVAPMVLQSLTPGKKIVGLLQPSSLAEADTQPHQSSNQASKKISTSLAHSADQASMPSPGPKPMMDFSEAIPDLQATPAQPPNHSPRPTDHDKAGEPERDEVADAPSPPPSVPDQATGILRRPGDLAKAARQRAPRPGRFHQAGAFEKQADPPTRSEGIARPSQPEQPVFQNWSLEPDLPTEANARRDTPAPAAAEPSNEVAPPVERATADKMPARPSAGFGLMPDLGFDPTKPPPPLPRALRDPKTTSTSKPTNPRPARADSETGQDSESSRQQSHFDSLTLPESSLAVDDSVVSRASLASQVPDAASDATDQAHVERSGEAPVWSTEWGAWMYFDQSSRRWLRHDDESASWVPVAKTGG